MTRTQIRNRAVAMALAAPLALGVLTYAAPAAHAEERTGPSVRAFTLNVRYTLSTEKAVADAKRAMSLGSVGGFQEWSGPRDRAALRDAVAARGWEIYMPRDAGVTIPIVWNAAQFSLISASSQQVHPAEEGVTPARYINHVLLRERATNAVLAFVNTHTIAQASRDAQPTNKARVPRLLRHIRMLRATIRSLFTSTANVIAVGDLNINYLADRRRQLPGFPTRVLGDVIRFDMPMAASWGTGSLLDYVMSMRDNGGLAFASSRIVGGFHSDHDAVLAHYRFRNLFAAQTLRNAPRGAWVARYRVIDRVIRAARDAEAGSALRVRSGRISLPSVRSALAAAQARGVDVEVKRRPEMRGAVVVVERAGAASRVVLVGSRWLTRASVQRETTLQIRTRPEFYRYHSVIHNRL